MSKTIKVIDLLNKIANGEIEEGQQFIIHFKEGLTRKIYYRGWESEKTNISSLRYYSDNNVVQDEYDLNDEVEIIEEQEKIDIQNIEDIKDVFIENSTCGEDVKYLARKYNEILKWAKQIEKKIKEKK